MNKIAQLVVPLMLVLGAAASAAEPAYTINPGDVLQINVWKEEGLDIETLVLPDGSLSFPLIGTISTDGTTTAQLQDLIKEKLTPFIPDASVSVAVKVVSGNVINVIGQVTKPGEQIPGRRVTVMQALSAAGGLTPYASTGNIIILRRTGGQESAIPFPYDDVSRGRSLDKDIILQPGDVVVVPSASLF